MKLNLLQKGFNYSQDGPGNRLVYHLQGCNLHCPWCSNPESMEINASNAVEITEMLEEAVRAKPMFFDGGGITFTGGEPTVQFEPLKELLTLLKNAGINTAIETNGTSPRLPELFGLIDFLIMDFKHYDSKKLKQYTGAGNETTLENIRSAARDRKQLLLRIPLINGFNAAAEDAMGFASALAPYTDSGMRLEVLRYHEYGKDKWLQAGREYTMHDAFVDDEQLEEFCDILKSNRIELIKT